ncbi:hypothetical protein [Amycolatopsis sp. DSM 110486]|uniref:hypothetical protein n=1 Tax=Amycolatopsis sp. DSM 110486 TaxID=2865832 RepID=UPI001C6A6DA5|nr:hypothetical protein [Amycolatopsis sp. DSM 110486]QYN17552.1 hypothetical protein K1T34_32725 [Amycolatopsis sp. DSM 110486]
MNAKAIAIIVLLALLIYIVKSPNSAADTVSHLLTAATRWAEQLMLFFRGVARNMS